MLFSNIGGSSWQDFFKGECDPITKTHVRDVNRFTFFDVSPGVISNGKMVSTGKYLFTTNMGTSRTFVLSSVSTVNANITLTSGFTTATQALATNGLVYMFPSNTANILVKFNPVNNTFTNIAANIGLVLDKGFTRALAHPNGNIYAFTNSLDDGIYVLDSNTDKVTIQPNPLQVAPPTSTVALDANAHLIFLLDGFYDVNPEDWTYEFYAPNENADRINGSDQAITFGINGHTLWIPNNSTHKYLKDWNPYTKTGTSSTYSYQGSLGYRWSCLTTNGHLISTPTSAAKNMDFLDISPDQGDIAIPVGLLINPYFNQ
jgi:hypothetical protein